MEILEYKLKKNNYENIVCILSSLILASSVITLLVAGIIGYENSRGVAFIGFNSIWTQ